MELSDHSVSDCVEQPGRLDHPHEYHRSRDAPPTTAPTTDAATSDIETGSFKANVPTTKIPTMANRGHISGRYELT